MKLQPGSVEELQQIVQSHRCLLPCGGGTKPALSTPAGEAVQLEMSRLAGIIEYEPGEYTFTAYAGTPVRQVVAVLAENGQYLPFDPLLVEEGATLGGTVAANTSGSGRYRYGGVRDFILGVHFIDGHGQLVRSGGKVVKNSAGFDLPKFMVGSLGRFGVLVDMSFKVFPEPRAYMSLQVTYASLDSALQAIYHLSTAPFDLDILDLVPVDHQADFMLVIRLGGLAEALPGRVERLHDFLKRQTGMKVAERIEGEAETNLWQVVNSCRWVAEGMSLVKAPLAPKSIPILEQKIAGGLPRRYTAGGNIAWLASPDVAALDVSLTELGLAGLSLFGPPGRPYLGLRKGLPLAQRVKQALDPAGKFLDL